MKNRGLYLTIAILLASIPALASADVGDARSLQSVATDGPVSVTTKTDKATARVAEPIHLILTVEAPRGTRIELPSQLESKLGDFEVRKSEPTNDVPSATHPDNREWALRLTLESIKTGELTIPPLEVHFTTDANSSTFKTLRTSPIPIHITSVLENRADPTRFRDIKQTVDVPVPATPSRGWIAWTIGGVGVAVAALFLLVVARRRRSGPSPAAWALAGIKELEQSDVSQAGGAESLFNEVVDVVREFFELEFSVPTMSRTAREFLAEASNEVGLPDVASKRLAWLASVADEIKFARLGVSEKHVRHAFAQAKAFIAECEEHRSTSTKGARDVL